MYGSLGFRPLLIFLERRFFDDSLAEPFFSDARANVAGATCSEVPEAAGLLNEVAVVAAKAAPCSGAESKRLKLSLRNDVVRLA